MIVGNHDSVVQTGELIDQLIDAIYPEGKPTEQTATSKTFIFLPIEPEDIAIRDGYGETRYYLEFVQISNGVIAVGSTGRAFKIS